MSSPAGRGLGWASLALAGAGAVGFLFAAPARPPAWLPGCLFHALTGFYCPGCGSTRAMYRLAHLDLAGAWRMNPAAVVAVPFVGLLILRERLAGRMAWARRPLPRWLIPAVLAAVLLWGVLRNLPWHPFTLWTPSG